MKALKGRVPAIKNLEEKIKQAHDDIAFVQSLEYGTYFGTVHDKQWVRGGPPVDTSSEILCEIVRVNLETVRVKVLTVRHLTSEIAYYLRSNDSELSISFDKFRKFEKKEIGLSDVPLYLNANFVSKYFTKKYLE